MTAERQLRARLEEYFGFELRYCRPMIRKEVCARLVLQESAAVAFNNSNSRIARRLPSGFIRNCHCLDARPTQCEPWNSSLDLPASSILSKRKDRRHWICANKMQNSKEEIQAPAALSSSPSRRGRREAYAGRRELSKHDCHALFAPQRASLHSRVGNAGPEAPLEIC